MNDETTFGPAYEERIDKERILTQMDRVREFCLDQRRFLTLDELSRALRYPTTSISAQLRHLRKEKFGSYIVEKRRRGETGTWEYRVLPPAPQQSKQGELFEGARS